MSADGSEADTSGTLNPYKKRVGSGPSPGNTAEQRDAPSPAEQAPSDVFHQEASMPSRLLTPEARGQTITFREGQTTERRVITTPPETAYTFQTGPGNAPNPNVIGEEETGSGHSVRYQSEAWWQEDRVKRNPARKGETEK